MKYICYFYFSRQWGILKFFLYYSVFGLVFVVNANAQAIVILKVTKDLAPVYLKPDFDSKVIYSLKRNQKIYGTQKTKEGLGGLGLFHKVQLNKKKKIFGYVLDTDLKKVNSTGLKKKSVDSLTPIEKERRRKIYLAKKKRYLEKKRQQQIELDKKQTQEKKQALEQSQKAQEDYNQFNLSKKKSTQSQAFFYNQYAGFQFGMVNFKRETKDGEKSSQEWLAGLKITGPRTLFKNFMLDLNLTAHYGAPQFFDDFSTDATGFFILAECGLPFELSRTRNANIYAGVGPMVSASFFEFFTAGKLQKSNNTTLGGVVYLGIGYEIGNYALKLEPKFYFEDSSYFALLAAIQKKF